MMSDTANNANPRMISDGPSRVKESWVIAALALYDGRPDPDVGQELEPHDEDGGERHQAEGVGD